MDIKTQIGIRIKELRNEKNISQEALAFSANIDRKYLSDIELGKRNVSILIVSLVATALDVSMHEFFSESFNK